MTSPDSPLSPSGSWHLPHVEQLCQVLGLTFTPPQAEGQHCTVSHPELATILTVPAGRAIQPIFIRELIALALAAGAPDVAV